MKPEHMIQMGNKDFVLWPGLLDEAHDKGLVGLYTELLQIPTPDNQDVAIVKAKAILQQDNVTKTFEGIGDASPRNTTKLVGMALIRMAETRAKARALRDAVNIGMTAYEELDEEAPDRTHGDNWRKPIGGRLINPQTGEMEDVAIPHPVYEQKHEAKKQPPKDEGPMPNFDEPHGNGRGPASDENILSDKQMKFIHVLIKQNGIKGDPNEITQERYGCRISDLSKANARDFIDWLQAGEIEPADDPNGPVDDADLIELTGKAKEIWGAEAIARTELTKLIRKTTRGKKAPEMTRKELRTVMREMGKIQEAADRAHAAMI